MINAPAQIPSSKLSKLKKNINRFVSYSLLANIFNTFSGIIVAIIAGSTLHVKALAIIGLITPFNKITEAISLMIRKGMGNAIIAYKAKQNLEETDNTFTAALLFILFIGIVYGVILYFNRVGICYVLTQYDQTIFKLLQKFIIMLCVINIFWLISDLIGEITLIDNNIKIYTTLKILTCLFYAGGVYLFLIVFRGKDPVYIAIASLISYILGTIIAAIYYFVSEKRTLSFHFLSIKNIINKTKTIICYGFPYMQNLLMTSIEIFVANFLLSEIFGDIIGPAILLVCHKVQSIIDIFFTTIKETVIIFIGKLFGQKNFAEIEILMEKAIQTCLKIAFLGSISCFIGRLRLPMLFGLSRETAVTIAPLFFLYSLSFFTFYLPNFLQIFYSVTNKRKLSYLIGFLSPGAIDIMMLFLLFFTNKKLITLYPLLSNLILLSLLYFYYQYNNKKGTSFRNIFFLSDQ